MRTKLGIGLLVSVALCCVAMPAAGDWVTPTAMWDHSSPTVGEKGDMIDGSQSTYYKLEDDDPAETDHCTNYVILDLGDTYTVEGFRFYPRIHASAATGPEDIKIFYFADESQMPTDGYVPNVTAMLALDGNIVIAATDTLPAIHGDGEYSDTLFAPFQARYVGVWSLSSYDGGSDGQNTFAEVAFNVTPEPATLALLGIGGLCAIRRKR